MLGHGVLRRAGVADSSPPARVPPARRALAGGQMSKRRPFRVLRRLADDAEFFASREILATEAWQGSISSQLASDASRRAFDVVRRFYESQRRFVVQLDAFPDALPLFPMGVNYGC